MLILKKEGRSEFKKPFGKLYPSIKDLKNILQKYITNNNLIISIGDATTINLQKEGIIPHMGIIDNRIEREDSTYEDEIFYDKVQLNAENPPGTITTELWETLIKGFQLIKAGHYILIVVDGEEDLAVLPCVIIAPPGSVILYGQPGKGVVLCEVDKFKSKAKNLIDKFEETHNGNQYKPAN